LLGEPVKAAEMDRHRELDMRGDRGEKPLHALFFASRLLGVEGVAVLKLDQVAVLRLAFALEDDEIRLDPGVVEPLALLEHLFRDGEDAFLEDVRVEERVCVVDRVGKLDDDLLELGAGADHRGLHAAQEPPELGVAEEALVPACLAPRRGFEERHGYPRMSQPRKRRFVRRHASSTEKLPAAGSTTTSLVLVSASMSSI
jgi:hypothetical protein